MRTPPSLPEDLGLDRDGGKPHRSAAALAAGRSVLSEVEAKGLLAAYGIPVVPTEVARDPAEVGVLAERWIAEHGACVIKILSDDISHKSDVGGVRLGLERAEEAERAAEDMLAAHRAPGAGGEDQGLHGAADDPPPRRPRADPRHVGRPHVRAADDVRRRRHGGRGAARHGARAAAARPQSGARPDAADARVAAAAGLPQPPGGRRRPHRRDPRPAQLSRGAPSRDPRDRHQSADRRRQGGDRARRQGAGCRRRRPARACRWRSGPIRRSGRRKRTSSRSAPSAFARSGPRTRGSMPTSSPT